MHFISTVSVNCSMYTGGNHVRYIVLISFTAVMPLLSFVFFNQLVLFPHKHTVLYTYILIVL